MGNEGNRRFDTIVIGSGMGGLTTAALLSRLQNQSVLVLEKHHTPGGFTHSFQRQGKYTWDVGVHYVGGMSPGKQSRRLVDFVSEGRLKWSRLPDPYDVFVYPDETFGVPADPGDYRNKLVDRFPGESENVDAYFRQVNKASSWYRRYLLSQSLPGILRGPVEAWNWFTRDYADRTTRESVEALIDDEKLQSLLVTNWGDYGLLPSESSFVVHAIVTSSYFGGAYYPVGGSETIAESILPTIESNGGECQLNSTVEEIVVENGRARGVRVRDEKNETRRVFESDAVVSNAGAHTTYRRLLSTVDDERVDEVRTRLKDFPVGRSFVTLYLGLKSSPKSLGVNGENYWIKDSWDHDRDSLNPFEVLRGDPSFCFLSFGSENDPEADYHTAQAITMAPYRAFESWADESWPRRSEDYQQLKDRIGDGLLGLAERAVPGLRELVDFREVSTPLSIEYFTGHEHGAPYGVPATPQRYHSNLTGVETPIENLYLTGADGGCPGVMGAAFSGLFAAARVLGGIGGPYQALDVIR